MPSGPSTASSRTGATGPVVPAQSDSAVVSSTSWPRASSDTAVEPIKRARPQDGLHGPDDVLERAGHRRGGEEHGEVGLRRHDLEDLAQRLAGRLGGDRVLGEGGGEGHVSPPGAAG